MKHRSSHAKVAARLLVFLPLMLLGLLFATDASAATRYQHTAPFGSISEFSNPQRMAVHQASGHLFIADRTGNRVRIYQADSELPLTHLGDLTAADRDDGADNLDQPVALAVDQDSGELYVAKVGAPAELVRFTPVDPADPVEFTEDTTFNSPTGFNFHVSGSFFDVGKVRTGVAIGRDAADNPLIFMLDPGANQLRAFAYSGTPAVVFGGFLPASTTSCVFCAGGSFSNISDLASGPDGSLYVTDVNSGQVRLRRFARPGATYDLANTWLTGLTPTTPRVAVDQLSSEIVVANQTHYAQIEGHSSPSVRFTASIPPTPGFFGAATTAVAVLGDDGTLGKRFFATGVMTTTFDFTNYVVGTAQIHVFDADGELPVAPGAEMGMIADSNVGSTAMQLSGSVMPGEVGGKYRFEAVPCDADWNCAAWPSTPALSDPSLQTVPITVGDHKDSQPVSGELSGLEPNTNYRARLLAINSDSAVPSPQVRETRTKLAAPSIVAGEAYSISAWRAGLTADLDPKHADTLYQFELTPTGGDPVLVPEQPLELSGGAGAGLISAEAIGLEPDTEYSFRLIAWPAEDESLESVGDSASFTTRSESDSILPRRAYELVSPLFTNGVQSSATTLAPSGERALFKTRLPLADSENMNVDNRISRRNPDGSWTVLPHRAGPPLVPGRGSLSFDAGRNPLVNQSHTHAAFPALDTPYDSSDDESYGGYLRDVESGELTWISSDPVIKQSGVTSRDVEPLYVSDDARQVIFSSGIKLLPSDQGNDPTLYEWKDGVVRQVAFRPGSPNPVGPSQRSLLGGGYGNSTVGGGIGNIGEYRNAVSADGLRIVYTIDGLAGTTFRELYVNDGGNIVQVAPTTSHAEFVGASRDVSTVVFVQDGNLYTFDMDAENLAAETPELVHPSVSGGAGVYRALFVSDDGNRIYFASTKDVLGGSRDTDPYALWVADRPDSDTSYSVRYITATPRVAWNTIVGARQYGADTKGEMFAFLSTANLVPGRRTGGEPQAYVYEYAADRMYCMSCPIDASPAPGPASLQPGVPDSGGSSSRLGGDYSHDYHPATRVISETGSVIFGSMSQLLPEDGDQISDVYEWRGGEIALISGGSGRYDDASEISLDGKSILFTSPANLMEGLPESSVRRVYVAREDGGFIDNSEASTPCRGAECRVLDREAPVVPSRGSASGRSRHATTTPKRNCRPAARRLRAGHRSVAQGRKRLVRLRDRDAKPAHLKKARKRLSKAKTNQRRLAKRLNSCRRAAR